MNLPVRLPAHVRPTHYKLSFDIDPAKDGYSGQAVIALDVRDPTAVVELHAVGLTIDAASLRGGPKAEGEDQPLSVTAEPARERLRLQAERPVPAGPATLTLAFRGQLQRGLRGLYKASAGGGHYAFTQFEPADARRAFPCFDEPAQKAVFEISINVPEGLTAYSNGALVREQVAPERRREFHFAPTPVISTYLVALAVGRFGEVRGQSGETPVRVLALPGKEALGELARDMAVAFLPILEEYFGIPYPYGKLDLMAAPDFEAGAMENAGLILFRESLLLLDKGASLDAQRQVALTTAHEMAHQWFGNLVTMEWWDDLWLNEAFATWMEFKVVEAYAPDWKIWTDFERMKAVPMHLDSLQNTRPIQAQVRSPEQANEMFDGITYNKGAAVLRMFEVFLGEDRFRQGVRSYLAAHAGRNATSSALWDALEKASGQPVDLLAESWFTRPGYPLLSLRLDGDRVAVSQRRFFAKPGHRETAAPWAVPLSLKVRHSGADGRAQKLIETAEGDVDLDGAELVFGNAEGSGFYRVAYEGDLLARVAGNAAALSPVERVSLLANQWAQVRAGATLTPHLDLMDRFGQTGAARPERTVLETLIAQLGALDQIVVEDGDRPLLAAWVRALLEPCFAPLGVEARAGESPDQQLLRPRLCDALGRIGEAQPLRDDLDRRLTRWLAGERAALPTSLLGPALQLRAQRGDLATWELFRKRMGEAQAPEEHDRFLVALGAFEGADLVRMTLELSLGGEVRAQDLQILLAYLFQNRAARSPTWAFVQRRWAEVARKAPVFGLRRILAATANLVDARQRAEVEAFFMDPAHHVEAGERELRQALEAIDLGLSLRERERASLGRWLAQQARAG